MPGGIWTSQNKVRPGAYINFEGEPSASIQVGERGIAALTLPLSWGVRDGIITLTANDLITGDSLKKVGLVYGDEDALLLRLALENCNTLKILNSNTGGAAATKTITMTGGDLVVTAKYNGTFGNKIAILVKVVDGTATVETYADGYFVDRQNVASNSISSLQENDYVTFSGSGTLKNTASTLLAGGTDGSTMSNLYSTFFGKLKDIQFNTVAITSTTSADLTLASQFAQQMRENEGKYIQVVISNGSADYEGVINVINGVVLEDGTNVTPAQFTSWVAGATAGANMTDSLTGKVVNGAVSIVDQKTNDEIIAALQTGKFVLALNQNGTIRVEKDINSLHTFTPTKGYAFSKNRIIRELDEIGSSIKDVWETTYLGKVSNNEAGRTLFKSSIIDYLSNLQNRGAIDEFDASNVTVEKGDDVDAVVAYVAVKPVDSMEFLYMTVTIS